MKKALEDLEDLGLEVVKTTNGVEAVQKFLGAKTELCPKWMD